MRQIFYMRYLIIILFIGLMGNSLFSQSGCPELKNKKAIKKYEYGLIKLKSRLSKDKTEAYKALLEATKIDDKFFPAFYELAEINMFKAAFAEDIPTVQRYNNKAVKYYESSIKGCESYMNYDAQYKLGYIYYNKLEYEKALEYLSVFVKNGMNNKSYSRGQKMYNHCEKYIELITKPVSFSPVKIEGVSTQSDEFLPLISPDGEFIFYTRKYQKHKKGELTSKYVNEFTYSKRTNDLSEHNPKFSTGFIMPPPFNNGADQGAISISIDNNNLYLTICKDVRRRSGSGKYTNCDLYVSHFVDEQWTEPQNLGPNINGRYTWESQPSISADGKTLYFASMRPTNIGFDVNNSQTYNVDLYYSEKDKNDKWLPAKNLGKVINTEGNEKSPFMHSDSQTLYFSSDGREGIGGYDIYYSQKNDKGIWSTPKNIGYPINTAKDEVGLIVSTNGEKAYFSSNKIGDGKGYDIYSFDLYEEARPKRVLFAKGKLADANGNIIAGAKIEVKSTKTNKITSGLVDSSTGKYAIAVAVEDNEEFLMTVKKEDFAFTSAYLKPKTEELLTAPVKINFEMKPIEVGAEVEIKDIHFASNSSLFDKESMFVLNSFVEFLEDNPRVKIEIQGHTDNIGNPKANMELSKERAKAVRDFLILMGIDSTRIVAYKGFGQSKPVASNNTIEGRAKNRRTEFVIVAK